MQLNTFLGIDLGTSELKLLLLGADGDVVATAGAPLAVSQPQPTWSEQDPASWVSALQAAAASLRATAPQAYSAIAGIGLSGHMHGATLLGADASVLRPCILWNDSRSALDCAELKRRCPDVELITGNLVMPGFTAPKLLWVAQHEPDVFARVAKVLLPKDYLRFALTGEYVSEMSDAAGTLWLDVARRDWSPATLSATGLTLAHMPRLVEGSEVSAHLSAQGAKLLGLPVGLPVAGGAGDNAASAIGLGAVHAGDGFVSLGTSGVIFTVSSQFAPNTAHAVHAFCHALPQSWHQMSVMLSAASCLRWVTGLTGFADEASLLAQVSQLDEAQRAASPVFLPYLTGERTPHNDAQASGAFFGLRPTHTAAHLAYAVIEGVSFGLLDGLNALRAAGSSPTQLPLVGGGAKSPLWAQLLADVLQIDILTYKVSSVGAALGAARLGQLAAQGGGAAAVAKICVKPSLDASYRPDMQRTAHLAQRYQQFGALYRALQPVFGDAPG